MSEGQTQPSAGGSVKHSAASGVKWTALLSVVNAVTSPLLRIFLARLLAPADFAQIAVVNLAVSASRLVQSMGIGEALVQSRHVTKEQVSSIFHLMVIFSCVIGACLFCSAGGIQRYYGYEGLGRLLRIISISVVLNGSTSLLRAYLQRSLRFRETSLCQIGMTLVNAMSVVALVSVGHGLAGYALANVVASTFHAAALTHFAVRKTDFRLRLHLRLREVKRYWDFGIFVSLKQAVTFVSGHVDEVIIARFLSAETFGVYYFAKDFLSKPHQLIGSSFVQVLLPVFSRLNESHDKLRRAYLRITKTVSLVAFPVFAGIGLTSTLFVPVLFGDKWVNAAWIIQVFSFLGILRIMTYNIASSLLYSLNRPRAVFYVDLLTTAAYLLGLLAFSRFGLLAALGLYGVFILSNVTALQIVAGRAVKTPTLSYVEQLKTASAATLAMGSAVLLLECLTSSVSNGLRLLVACMVGVATYVGTAYAIDRSSVIEMKDLLRKKRRA